MATGGKLFRGIHSFVLFLFITILLSIPFNAEGSSSTKIPAADVTSHTGAATLSIPIEVPPGRNGIEPNLSLTYNSYQGNGWVGVGWDLDVGFIQRSTKLGVDYDANDFVAMDGSSSELVPRPEWGNGYYGAKIEAAFTKYYLNPATGGWEVTAKDGTKYFYGSSVYSRQDNNYEDKGVASSFFTQCQE